MFDINTIRGILTLIFLLLFIGLCFWAFNPRQKKRFDDAANLPFKYNSQNNLGDKL